MVKDKRKEAAIIDAWTNTKNVVAFTNSRRVYNFLRKRFPSLTHADVLHTLQGIDSFTLHRRVFSKFKRRRTLGHGVNFSLQMDMIDYGDYLRRFNDGYRYILIMICVFSKRIYTHLLKSKSANEVCAAIREIFKKNNFKPVRIYCDSAREFRSKEMNALLKEYEIRIFFPTGSENKSAVVERAIRSVRSLIERQLTHLNTYRFVDLLDRIIANYNNSPHKSLKGKTPNSITNSDTHEDIPLGRIKQPRYNIGDFVRIVKKRSFVEKKFRVAYTSEVFVIVEAIAGSVPVYRIKSETGEAITGIFYEQEFSRVRAPRTHFKIEAILRSRVYRGRKQKLVKFINYKKPEWVNNIDIIDLK